jgi:hypothetical protein
MSPEAIPMNIKNRLILERKFIYDEFKSVIALVTDMLKKYRFSAILLLIWIVSIPLLFYFLNSGVGSSSELLRVEIPIIFSWAPLLLSFYHGIIHRSD